MTIRIFLVFLTSTLCVCKADVNNLFQNKHVRHNEEATSFYNKQGFNNLVPSKFNDFQQDILKHLQQYADIQQSRVEYIKPSVPLASFTIQSSIPYYQPKPNKAVQSTSHNQNSFQLLSSTPAEQNQNTFNDAFLENAKMPDTQRQSLNPQNTYLPPSVKLEVNQNNPPNIAYNPLRPNIKSQTENRNEFETNQSNQPFIQHNHPRPISNQENPQFQRSQQHLYREDYGEQQRSMKQQQIQHQYQQQINQNLPLYQYQPEQEKSQQQHQILQNQYNLEKNSPQNQQQQQINQKLPVNQYQPEKEQSQQQIVQNQYNLERNNPQNQQQQPQINQNLPAYQYQPERQQLQLQQQQVTSQHLFQPTPINQYQQQRPIHHHDHQAKSKETTTINSHDLTNSPPTETYTSKITPTEENHRNLYDISNFHYLRTRPTQESYPATSINSFQSSPSIFTRSHEQTYRAANGPDNSQIIQKNELSSFLPQSLQMKYFLPNEKSKSSDIDITNRSYETLNNNTPAVIDNGKLQIMQLVQHENELEKSTDFNGTTQYNININSNNNNGDKFDAIFNKNNADEHVFDHLTRGNFDQRKDQLLKVQPSAATTGIDTKYAENGGYIY